LAQSLLEFVRTYIFAFFIFRFGPRGIHIVHVRFVIIIIIVKSLITLIRILRRDILLLVVDACSNLQE